MGTDLFGAAGGADAPRRETRFADALTVADVKPGEAGTLTIDDYVRFAFESPAGSAGSGTVAIEDGPGSLAEVAIDLATGRLRGATLVTFSRRANRLHFDPFALEQEAGMPVLAVPVFDASDHLPRLTREGAIDAWRGEDVAVIQIAAGEPDRLIRIGDRAFVLTAGPTLWGFGADRLAREDMMRMTA